VIAKLASALALLAVIGSAFALARYEAARDAWRPLATTQGTPAYDAAASDIAYRAVADALVWVDRSAKAAAVLVVVVGVALGRTRPRSERHVESRARRIAARSIDMMTLAAVLVLTRLSLASPGATVAIHWLAPSLALSLLAFAAANGATVGDRVTAAAKE
jgi:hypothetical protein